MEERFANDLNQGLQEKTFDEEPVMETSCLRVYLALSCLTVTDTSYLSLLPFKSIRKLETVASSIIQHYAPFMYDVQIICESTCVSDEFVKAIPVPIQLARPNLHENSFLFLLPQSQSFVTTVLDSAANSTKSKYVVMVECGGCATVAWILEQCWRHKLLNVVVIPMQNNSSPIYTYFPFRENYCFDPSPSLIASFTDSFHFNVELFPERKVWNLQNCTLKVSSFNFKPGVYFDGTGMHGHYVPIFKAVADAMNFSYKFILTDGWFGGVSGPNKTGIRGDVYTGRAHLGFTFFLSADVNYLDYDSLAMNGCTTWCVPGTIRKKPIWLLIFGEFSPAVWFSLFVSAISVVLATVLLAQRLDRINGCNSDAVMYMNVWAALLQSPGVIPRYTSISLRLVWLGWLVASVVLSTVYLGTQKSLRTAPYKEYSVKNLEDLADTGFQAWYAKNLGEMIDEGARTNPAIARMRSNSYAFSPDQYGTLSKLFRFRNITGLMTDRLCRTFGEAYVGKFDLYPVRDACMQMSQFHFFAMVKHSVFTETIAILMGRLNQAGVVQKGFYATKTAPSTDIQQRPITMIDILPVILLLGFGLSAGLVALLIESLLRHTGKSDNVPSPKRFV